MLVNVVHCGSIRQTASIISMSRDFLRTGDKAHVHFRFIKHPEYIKAEQRLVFREGRTKAVGNILKVLDRSGNPTNQQSNSKKQERHENKGEKVNFKRKKNYNPKK